MIAVPIPSPSTPPAADIKQMPGKGIRLTVSTLGNSYAVPSGSRNFKHPFRPSIGADTIKFSLGLVDVYEPKIKGVPISGGTDKPQPALKLDPAKVNAFGETWIVLEVEPDLKSENGQKGLLGATARIELVQTAEPDLHSDTIGRQPIAMIAFKRGSVFRVFPIVHFNLRYQRVTPAPGGGPVRHLFL